MTKDNQQVSRLPSRSTVDVSWWDNDQVMLSVAIPAWGQMGWDMPDIASRLGVTTDELAQAMCVRPELARVVELARTHSAHWWHEQLRRNLKTKGFNSAGWIRWMVRHHGWEGAVDTGNSKSPSIKWEQDDVEQ